jgi:hypothetical protein
MPTVDVSAGGRTLVWNNDAAARATISGGPPENAVPGDLLLAFVSVVSANNPVTITPPSGWTQFFTPSYLNGLFSTQFRVYRRIMQAGDTTWSWDVPSDTADEGLLILRVTGFDANLPIDSAPTSPAGSSDTGSPPSQAISTTSPDALVFNFITYKNSSKLDGGAINTNYPTNMTGILLQPSRTSSSAIIMGLAFRDAPTVGIYNQDPWPNLSASNDIDYVNLYSFSIRNGLGGGVTISNVTPTTLANGQTGITITGTGFGATQGSGQVRIGTSNSNPATGAVAQAVTAWSDTSITITAVQGALPSGSTVFLYVTENGGTSNSTGFPVSFGASAAQLIAAPRRQVFVIDKTIQH